MTQRWKAGLGAPMVSPTKVKAWSSLLKTVRTTSTKKGEGMGASDSPLLQLSFDPRLGRGSRAVIYLLKKRQPFFEGAGKKKNTGRISTCLSTYFLAFRYASPPSPCSKCLLHILPFYAHTTLLRLTAQVWLWRWATKMPLEQEHSRSRWQGLYSYTLLK